MLYFSAAKKRNENLIGGTFLQNREQRKSRISVPGETGHDFFKHFGDQEKIQNFKDRRNVW